MAMKLLSFLRAVFTRWSHFRYLAPIILVGDLLLSLGIVAKIPYTEIDWEAYMSEVEGFLDGDWDYMNLKGATGPLVYPAGFVYIYSALRWATDNGTNILKGQYIFVGIYCLQLAILLAIFRKIRICPPWVACLLSASRRIHSIFVLRLFNDGIAMTLLYAAILLFCYRKWFFGSVMYSLAVSVKMNIFLFAPGLLALYLRNHGVLGTIKYLAVCGVVQLLVGAPFLMTFPKSYLMRAFELSRVFQHEWTVNLKFLSPSAFRSPEVAISLLALHVILLLLFLIPWSRARQPPFQVSKQEQLQVKTITNNRAAGGVTIAEAQLARAANRRIGDASAYMVYTLFLSNFIGIVCSRTLHYQFYSWYFHTLPLLLWQLPAVPVVIRLMLLLGIEVAFNVFPSNWWSSLVLQACHWIILWALWFNGPKAQPGRVKQD